MKKTKLISLLILAVLLVSIGACTQAAPATTSAPAPTSAAPAPKPSPSPATTAAPTTTAAPSPTAKPATTAAPVITLKAQTYFNDVHYVTKGYLFWINELEKRTNGKVKVDWVLADPYGKHANVFDLVAGGVVDFAHLLPSYTPGRQPLLEFSGTFPFDWKSSAEVAYVHAKLAAKGYFDKDLAAGSFKYLFGMEGAPYDFFTKNPVKVPTDLKGMKIRAAGGVMSRFVEVVGGIPVSMASAEQVVALQKGVLDGTIIQPPSVVAMKLYEVVKNQCVIGLSTWYGPMVATVATWNKLPADVQKVITDLAEEATMKAASFADIDGDDAVKQFPKLGVQTYKPTVAEMALWTAPIKPLLESEVGKLKAAGYPMDAFMKDFEQFRSEWRASHK